MKRLTHEEKALRLLATCYFLLNRELVPGWEHREYPRRSTGSQIKRVLLEIDALLER